jgi:glycyl-tRNA synthetase beta chain
VVEHRDLLVEIGTEELPPTALLKLSAAFEREFRARLEEQRLSFEKSESFATPRRLALLVYGLATRQADRKVLRKGPSLRAAFDEKGEPTSAASGFARSCGVSLVELEKEETPKGSWLVFRQMQRGFSTTDIIVDIAAKSLEALPIPKRMRWADREEEFVRPVHWITMVFGTEPIKGRLFGIDIGQWTRGHRFHRPAGIKVSVASEYPELLRTKGMVEPSFKLRRENIRTQAQRLAEEACGRLVVEDALLDEVTALCEWPCAIMGAFDESFLEVPSEVLKETMQKHQKYFPIISSEGALLPRFITISNIQSLDPSEVRAGNERVIRPRFADAAFFWHQDLEKPLVKFSPRLSQVTFQNKLGTLAEKSGRVEKLSRHIAGLLGMNEELAGRAAILSKCDLVTQMVFEFPSLQGTMGRYYAERSGEDPCVAAAIDEQYLPRYADDTLPLTSCGQVLAVADKLDTLVGIFAIGLRPTGVKDPYALRRASIGILRIIIETPLPFDLMELLERAAEGLQDRVDTTSAATEVFDYCMERLKKYLQSRNISSDVVDSVLAIGLTAPSDIQLRALAIENFLLLPEANALIAAHKRIANILRKHDHLIDSKVDLSLLVEDAEIKLKKSVGVLKSEMTPLLKIQDYRNVLEALSEIRVDVDRFFDQVMVMAEDSSLRCNRFALLRDIEALFLKVADLSLLNRSTA